MSSVEPASDNRAPLDSEIPPGASPPPPQSGVSARLDKDAPAAPKVDASLAGEEYEKELFGRIMSGARERTTPLRELKARANALAFPEKRMDPADVSSLAAGTAQREENWSGDLDTFGNPRWITLSLPERKPENDRIEPESILPPSLKIFPEKPDRQDNGPRRQQPAGILQTLLARLRLQPRPSSDNAHPYTRHARPMRGFFRMLLLTAILAMIYHILSQKGWVPRLF